MTEKKAPSDLFPERLRAARKLRGMDQVDLAAESKLPQASISHFEAGARKPSFGNLRRLAHALTVTTDYLLGRVDTPEMSIESDPLYRDMQNLSEDDRKLTQDFMKMLSQRRSGKDEAQG